jgi:two-component system nitrate/nitrite response regulator NarL
MQSSLQFGLRKVNGPNKGWDQLMHSDIPTFIIDPVMLFREGLRRILYEAGFQPVWCGDAPPVGPIPTLSEEVSPLLVIGTEVEEAMVQIVQMKRLYPRARLVLLLDDPTQNQVVAAFRCGVNTIVLRRSSCEALIGTLRLVLDGATVLPSDLLDTLLDVREGTIAANRDMIVPEIMRKDERPVAMLQSSGLSARELGVVRWLRDGMANKEIARVMGITEATVKVHVKAILRKTRVKNRTQVAMWASKLELGQPPGVQHFSDEMAEARAVQDATPSDRTRPRTHAPLSDGA